MKCRAMTKIMYVFLCVVVVVSVFFYAPMEVSAEEIVSTDTGSIECPTSGINSYKLGRWADDSLSLLGFDDNSYYSLNFHLYGDFEFNHAVWFSNFFIRLDNTDLKYFPWDTGGAGEKTFFYFDEEFTVILKGSDINGANKRLNYNAEVVNGGAPITDLTCDFNLSLEVVSYSIIATTDAESYQNGYNDGYSAGESAGYGNGYSNGFADGESSVDTDAIYDEAFQAGKDSVDTQSYYDAGYQAGYDAAYSAGYESGYDVGYQSAMDRIDGWGADTSDYPLLIQQTDGTFDLQFDFIQPARVDDVISDYCDIGRYYSGIDFNPNHTYRLDFTYHDFEYDYSDSYFTASYSFWLYWGSCSFPITVGTKDDITSSFYISGDQIGTGLKFRCDVSGLEAYSEYFGVLHYYINDCTLKLFDMGPSGDTQNHIANQTDQLTNGYDSSQGAAVNDDFKASVNEYHTAENSLFSTATTSLDNFTFLDFTSITGMVTSLSFVTSIMTSIYMAMGGDTGASGIILAVLFSVMLVSMAIGLYRYYVSNGKSDGSGKGGD